MLTTQAKQVLALARDTVTENHRWHETYDEFGGYPESQLESQNLGTVQAINELISDEHDNWQAPGWCHLALGMVVMYLAIAIIEAAQTMHWLPRIWS